MPTTIRPTARVGVATAKPVSYVKFSDKLTDSFNDIGRMIQDHKNMIDAIQEIALELTNSIGSLHTLTVKYAGIANNINLEAITQKIIDNQAATSKTITEVQSGLKTGDVNKIKGHAGALQNVTRTLTSILPKG